MLKTTLEKLEQKKELNEQESAEMLDGMLDEKTSVDEIKRSMLLLSTQHHNIDMLVGLTKALRKHMIQITPRDQTLDIVGTGGDNSHSLNISTGSALLMAACGVHIAKHGNRAVSSSCGSADVLEALGFQLSLPKEDVTQSINNHYFGFCFAPHFHPAFMRLRDIRKMLQVPTVFNLMGPLLNPANAEYLMIGVYDPALLSVFAKILARLPLERALVFHSEGLDELTPIGPAEVYSIEKGEIDTFTLDAKDYGIPRCTHKDLQGGNAPTNAALLMKAFEGGPGPLADTLAFNAGIGLSLYGITTSIQEGIQLAQGALNTGHAALFVKKIIGGIHE